MRSRPSLLIVLAVLLAAMTLRNAAVWRDDVTLWSVATAVRGESPRAWINLGAGYLKAGNVLAAESAYAKGRHLALMAPRSAYMRQCAAVAAYNLGVLASRRGAPEAGLYFEEVDRLWPEGQKREVVK